MYSFYTTLSLRTVYYNKKTSQGFFNKYPPHRPYGALPPLGGKQQSMIAPRAQGCLGPKDPRVDSSIFVQ